MIVLFSLQQDQAYKVVPQTQFQCGKRAAGYYADIDTGCQVLLLILITARNIGH